MGERLNIERVQLERQQTRMSVAVDRIEHRTGLTRYHSTAPAEICIYMLRHMALVIHWNIKIITMWFDNVAITAMHWRSTGLARVQFLPISSQSIAPNKPLEHTFRHHQAVQAGGKQAHHVTQWSRVNGHAALTGVWSRNRTPEAHCERLATEGLRVHSYHCYRSRPNITSLTLIILSSPSLTSVLVTPTLTTIDLKDRKRPAAANSDGK